MGFLSIARGKHTILGVPVMLYLSFLPNHFCYSCLKKCATEPKKPPTFFLKLALHIFNFPEEVGQSNKLVPFRSQLPNVSIAFIAASTFLNTLKY